MSKKRLKIVVFYSGYIPAKNFGGTVVSLHNMIETCGDRIDFYVITLNHDMNSEEIYSGIKNGVNVVGKANVYYLSDEQISTNYFKKLLLKIQPDIIYQASFFNYRFSLRTLRLSKVLSIPMILAPKGELCDYAYHLKFSKKWIFVQALRRFYSNAWFHVTSERELKDTKKNLKIQDRVLQLLPEIPTSVPPPEKSREKQPGKLKLVFLSRIVENKNLLFAIDLLIQMKHEIVFDIYGQIENKPYWEKCQERIGQAPSHIRIRYRGVADNDKVHKILSDYDAMLFPTSTENYGQVIAEALFSGCPVITSDQTPWSDLKEHGAGWVIPLKEPQKYLEALNELAGYNSEEYKILLQKCNVYLKRKIDIDSIANEYIQFFHKVGGSQ